MASFSASYALFLKLVSGTIRTTAMSASAMLNDASVVSSLAYRINKNHNSIIFGMPHARMSSCQRFQHLRDLTSSFLAYQMPYEPIQHAFPGARAFVITFCHHMKTG